MRDWDDTRRDGSANGAAWPASGSTGEPRRISGAPRRYVGTASAEANYLPPTDYQRQRAQNPRARVTPIRDAAAPRRSGTTARGNYLQTPRSGKPIFTSAATRKRNHTRLILAVLLVIVLALAIWFLFLR